MFRIKALRQVTGREFGVKDGNERLGVGLRSRLQKISSFHNEVQINWNMSLKFLAAIKHFCLMVGFNPRKLISISNYPKYLRHLLEFQRLGGEITHRYTILDDFSEQAGSTKGHYFHQDLLVASLIHKHNPVRHIDIGSRVDGFVAHVASYRPIEVFDVRELAIACHENIKFTRADLMIDDVSRWAITDSLSCLHALEHFGLGRYGDPIDPKGHIKGFNNLLKILKIEY